MPYSARLGGGRQQGSFAGFLAVFAHRRVALAGGGGSGGRCGWKLRSREAGSALAHAGIGDGHAERGGFPHESNLGRGQAVGLVCEVAERALQVQGFGGEGAGGLDGAGAFLAQGVEAGG